MLFSAIFVGICLALPTTLVYQRVVVSASTVLLLSPWLGCLLFVCVMLRFSPTSSAFGPISPLIRFLVYCSKKSSQPLVLILSTSVSGVSLCPPGEEKESILVAAPLNTTYSGGVGTVTHYILSVVPMDEIFSPVDVMEGLIQGSTTKVS